MNTSFSDVVKEGAVKMKSSKSRQWKRSFIVLKKPSSRGRLRIEKYEDEKSAIMGLECKIIDLSDVKSIEHLPPDVKRACISITFVNDSSRQFSCETDEEARMWLLALTGVFNKYGAKVGASDCFNVFLLPNPAMAFFGECLMHVQTDRILLTTVEDESEQIESWLFSYLRKFNGDTDKFTFEAGRRSRTGEGLFIFNTKEGLLIQESMQSAIRVLQEHERIVRMMKGSGSLHSQSSAPGMLSHSTSVNSAMSSGRSMSVSNADSFSISSSSPPGSSYSLMTLGRRSSDIPILSPRGDYSSSDLRGGLKDRPPVPTPRADIHNGRLVHYDKLSFEEEHLE